MKGLLLKDFHMAARYLRFYFIFLLLFVVGSARSDNIFLLLLFPLVLLAAVPMSLYSYDEKNGWERYCGAMPYSRRQLVSAKYIFALLLFVLELLLFAAAQAAAVLWGTAEWETYWLRLSVVPLGLLSTCVLLPAVFRLGTERGRIAYYVSLGLLGVLLALLNYSDVRAVVALPGVWCFLASLTGVLLLFAVSWCAAVRSYQKREF